MERSLRWNQEVQNELWIGHDRSNNGVLLKDVRTYAHLRPGTRRVGQAPFGTSSPISTPTFVVMVTQIASGNTLHVCGWRTAHPALSMPCYAAVPTVGEKWRQGCSTEISNLQPGCRSWLRNSAASQMFFSLRVSYRSRISRMGLSNLFWPGW